jgi:hypothetical protein
LSRQPKTQPTAYAGIVPKSLLKTLRSTPVIRLPCKKRNNINWDEPARTCAIPTALALIQAGHVSPGKKE